jgi:hypothetical protein
MPWVVIQHDEFVPEFDALDLSVQDEILAAQEVLAQRGPRLGRPLVDTLAGSRHMNMKEIRFRAQGGVWRVAFAFDRERQAIILVAGDKSGISQSRFYKSLIARADKRFDDWLERSL